MKISMTHTFTVTASQERVFAALVDPAVLQKCIDVCEKMEKTGEDSYAAHLKIGVAGIKRSYIGKVRIADQKSPESFTLHAEVKGGSRAGCKEPGRSRFRRRIKGANYDVS